MALGEARRAIDGASSLNVKRVLEALLALHYVHRDVKPLNYMLQGNGYLVLSDFGLAAGPASSDGRLRSRTGTRGYWAPEVVRREAQTASVDWWGVGVTLCYAACGVHPFHGRWERGKRAHTTRCTRSESDPTIRRTSLRSATRAHGTMLSLLRSCRTLPCFAKQRRTLPRC